MQIFSYESRYLDSPSDSNCRLSGVSRKDNHCYIVTWRGRGAGEQDLVGGESAKRTIARAWGRMERSCSQNKQVREHDQDKLLITTQPGQPASIATTSTNPARKDCLPAFMTPLLGVWEKEKEKEEED